jgi:hypothetical protein
MIEFAQDDLLKADVGWLALPDHQPMSARG